MKLGKITGGVALLACLMQPAIASAADYVAQPIPVGSETMRFDQGIPTVELQQRRGSIQVTPLPMDHGNLAFGIAVFNAGPVAADIDIGNVSAMSGGQRVNVLTTAQLVSKVKSRAIWKQIGIAAIGGLAAGLAASQRDYYHGSYRTPHGRARYSFSAPSIAGQIQAAAITGSTQYSMLAISAQLDRTRAAIGEESLQLSTVTPGESYAGKIVLARFKPTAYPQRIDIAIDWNGETYGFGFQIARNGTPQPVFPARAQTAPLMPAVVPATPTVAPRQVVIASAAPVAPRPALSAAPTRIAVAAYTRPRNSFEQTMAAQQGVHGREAKQGWTISD